jgi:hypothetical protein
VLALLASLSGFVCLIGIGGALGIILGLIAHREMRRSQERELGRGLASAAIVVGMLNLALAMVGVAAGITYLARPKSLAALRRGIPTSPVPAWRAPSPAPARKSSGNAALARASHEQGNQVTLLGAVTVVDISGNFAHEVDGQRSRALAAHEILVLWLVVPNCRPCAGVAAALTGPLAQKALGKVRLMRANRDEFQTDLEHLGIPTEKIPGFALLDDHNRPRDFIHGGEWDADLPANITPVLGKFVHGRYTARRHRWHGAVRDDETAL